MPYALTAGRFTFTWTGAWAAGSIYQLGDAAEHLGSVYLCAQPHLSSPANEPPNATFWELMVSVGPQGPAGPAGPMPPVVVLGSDQVRTLNTFANVAGLSVPVLADKDYFVEFEIIFRTAATGTGIAFAVDGPASPAAVVVQGAIPTGPTAAQFVHARAYNSGQASSGVDAANSDMFATITCVLRNGPNSGDLVLRFASEVNGSAVTVKAGSFARYHQLN